MGAQDKSTAAGPAGLPLLHFLGTGKVFSSVRVALLVLVFLFCWFTFADCKFCTITLQEEDDCDNNGTWVPLAFCQIFDEIILSGICWSAVTYMVANYIMNFIWCWANGHTRYFVQDCADTQMGVADAEKFVSGAPQGPVPSQGDSPTIVESSIPEAEVPRTVSKRAPQAKDYPAVGPFHIPTDSQRTFLVLRGIILAVIYVYTWVFLVVCHDLVGIEAMLSTHLELCNIQNECFIESLGKAGIAYLLTNTFMNLAWAVANSHFVYFVDSTFKTTLEILEHEEMLMECATIRAASGGHPAQQTSQSRDGDEEAQGQVVAASDVAMTEDGVASLHRNGHAEMRVAAEQDAETAAAVVAETAAKRAEALQAVAEQAAAERALAEQAAPEQVVAEKAAADSPIVGECLEVKQAANIPKSDSSKSSIATRPWLLTDLLVLGPISTTETCNWFVLRRIIVCSFCVWVYFSAWNCGLKTRTNGEMERVSELIPDMYCDLVIEFFLEGTCKAGVILTLASVLINMGWACANGHVSFYLSVLANDFFLGDEFNFLLEAQAAGNQLNVKEANLPETTVQ